MSGYHFEVVERNKYRNRCLASEFQECLLKLVKRFTRLYGREWRNGLFCPIALTLPCSRLDQNSQGLEGKSKWGKGGGGGRCWGGGGEEMLIHPSRRGPIPCRSGQIPDEDEDRSPLDNSGHLRKGEQCPCPQGAHRSQDPEFPRACVVRFVWTDWSLPSGLGRAAWCQAAQKGTEVESHSQMWDWCIGTMPSTLQAFLIPPWQWP